MFKQGSYHMSTSAAIRILGELLACLLLLLQRFIYRHVYFRSENHQDDRVSISTCAA